MISRLQMVFLIAIFVTLAGCDRPNGQPTTPPAPAATAPKQSPALSAVVSAVDQLHADCVAKVGFEQFRNPRFLGGCVVFYGSIMALAVYPRRQGVLRALV